MRKDSAAFNVRGRGSYAAQACNVCRSRKIKCDGVQPVCSSCGASGRDGECSWGRNIAVRKPRTEAHFEALCKRADALQAYADLLDGILAKCVCQDVRAHLASRPPGPADVPGEHDHVTDSGADELNSDEAITQELCVPAQSLKLDDKSGGLMRHGITTPMRFGTRTPEQVPRAVESVSSISNATYVLLLDGMDADYASECDWSRHLPTEVPLKRREHDRILDMSFKFFTMFCLRVVPSLFLRDMYRALSRPRTCPPKTPYYSPMLHNALIALAAIFSDDPRIRDVKARRHFINAAKGYLEAECQKPDISLVHALGLIGTFHGNEGEHILGDMYFGMGTRLSQALGLGMDPSAWVKSGLITTDEMLARNWAHWTIFSMDLCWTLYFGRDFCSPLHATPLPFVDHAGDQVPWFHTPANIPPQPNLLSTTFATSISLLLIARKIVDVVCVIQVSLLSSCFICFLELNNWKSGLPPELDITLSNRAKSTPQRLMLHLMYWWCFIVLHRPFFNRRARPVQVSERRIDHVKLCKRAAENIMELLETWSTLYSLRYTPPTILQVVFGAGTVFMLLALQATSSLRVGEGALRVSLAQADQCVQYLAEVGVSWRCAARTGDILRCLLEDRLKPIQGRRFSHEQLFRSETSSPSLDGNANLPSLYSNPPVVNVAEAVGLGPRDLEHGYSREGYLITEPRHPQPPFGSFIDYSTHGESIHFDYLELQSSSVSDALHGTEAGWTFSNLNPDISNFLLPTLDSFGSLSVWEETVLGTRWI
ncbi:hypothetical protein C8R43DRAFT_875329 [Mycena crocata]|nr:hypothetical protein C8R43DRAFT_875329 [Mycena crocata]